jgi:hypothetical protein
MKPPSHKENHGYFGLKGAHVADVRLKRRIEGCYPTAASIRFATKAGCDARKRSNLLGSQGSRQPQGR